MMTEENKEEHKTNHIHESKDTLTIKKKDIYKAGGIILALLAVIAVTAVYMGKTGINGNSTLTQGDYKGEKANETRHR